MALDLLGRPIKNRKEMKRCAASGSYGARSRIARCHERRRSLGRAVLPLTGVSPLRARVCYHSKVQWRMCRLSPRGASLRRRSARCTARRARASVWRRRAPKAVDAQLPELGGWSQATAA